ncbi:16S rRNA (guanine(527)-N(7))-methyltransferase RsmG [Melissospora conviva]|uniref:16S rRNA (guanine(527)-N(7))-methyltransferase RsmG n=1 Tax=Melissospora conviva TaxID=3388432 RepID=UPI003C24C58B
MTYETTAVPPSDAEPNPSAPAAEVPLPAPDTADQPAAETELSSAQAEIVLPEELTEAAQALFGDRLELASAYAQLLATDGVLRGLIGPREAPRIWDRHLLNCAAVAEVIPPEVTVLDVGSGAGLPGLVLAIARPDLNVVLIEPLARRTSFLLEAVQQLGLARTVRVVRGRAEEAAAGTTNAGVITGDIVTARAVAPLDRLAGWALPLLVRGGRVLALKGATAADEVAEHTAAVERLGGSAPVVHRCGVGVIDPPTTVVEFVRERIVHPPGARPAKKSRANRRGAPGRNRR